MNNPIVRKLITALLGILILVYVIYQMVVVGYVSVETETAELATLSDIYETQAYIVRNETVITGSTGRYVLDYAVEDGGKVAVGGAVVNLYAAGSAVGVQDQIDRLETEIALLERLGKSAESFAADPTVLSRLAGDGLTTLLANVTGGNLTDISSHRSNLLFRLNQMALVIDENFDYSARLAELQAEVSVLKASITGASAQITSPVSGFFSSTVDGYENVFSYADVEDITLEQLQSNIEPEQVPADAVGKVITNHEWYIVCTVDAETVLKLRDMSSVRVSMPSVTSTAVETDIVAVNQAAYNTDAAVVLRCTTVDGALVNARCETIELELKSCEGIMVRQDAIRFEDVIEVIENEDGTKEEVVHENVKGVYVLIGSRLEFVQIFSEVSANGYVVCKMTPDENDVLLTDHTLRLYDKVVVKGSDLYDGKVL